MPQRSLAANMRDVQCPACRVVLAGRRVPADGPTQMQCGNCGLIFLFSLAGEAEFRRVGSEIITGDARANVAALRRILNMDGAE